MADQKFSDFNAETDLTDFDGIVGFQSATLGGANANYYISPSNLYTTIANNISLNASAITSGTLDVARGGTGLASISTLQNSNVDYASDGTGTLPIDHGGTGITQYGQACRAILDTNVYSGGGTIANFNNDITYVAPLSTEVFNDDNSIYTFVPNSFANPGDWNSAIQVNVSGKYLVEATVSAYGNQNSNASMEMWISIVTSNGGYGSTWPTPSASVGDLYWFDGGRVNTTANGNGTMKGSKIITITANDYVRPLFRVNNFLGISDNYPVYNILTGTGANGVDGYQNELTITRIA